MDDLTGNMTKDRRAGKHLWHEESACPHAVRTGRIPAGSACPQDQNGPNKCNSAFTGLANGRRRRSLAVRVVSVAELDADILDHFCKVGIFFLADRGRL